MIRCDESKPYIFVSYSHRDTEKVVGIMDRLREEGYNVWYDGGIDPGTEWDENIAKHVKECTYFIAFISQGYIGSDNCKDELNYSRDLDKDRLLVYLEDVDLPDGMAMRMNRIQAIWWNKYDASNIDEAYKKLFTTRGIERAKVLEKNPMMGGNSVVKNIQTASTQPAVNISSNVSEPSKSEKVTAPTAKKKMPVWAFITGGAGLLVLMIVVLVIALGGRKDYEGQTLAWYMEEAEAGDEIAMRYLADCYYEGSNGAIVDYAKAVEWYEKAVENKDAAPEAYLGLGNCYANGGNGITKDGKEAMYWLEKAVEAGNTDAYYTMGLINFNGDEEVTKDYAKAVEYFEKATANGNIDAYYWMGRCYNLGDNGIERDDNKALECYTKAVENGNADAQLRIGHLYYSPSSSFQNRALAVENYDKAITMGVTDAYYWKGLCYYYGDNTLTKDYVKAVECSDKAVEYEYLNAWITLALCYYNGGNGVDQDYNKAFECYQKVEENGLNALKNESMHMANYALCYYKSENGNAQKAMEWFKKAETVSELTDVNHLNYYGNCYFYGYGLDKPDYKTAITYFEKAIQTSEYDKVNFNNIGLSYYYLEDYTSAVKYFEQGHNLGDASCTNNLADRYYFGEGVNKDYAKAVELYNAALATGRKYGAGINRLAICYEKGYGVEADINKAIELYKEAAALDNDAALYNLGLLYETGRGVTKDIEQAIAYYQQSADLGSTWAQEKLDALQ